MSNFVWSIKNGELDQVQEDIEFKNFDVNTEINGRYPLHYAADFGHDDVVLYLIKKGANVNLADKHGITPLLAALWEGHTKCVEILLEHGASKSGQTPDGIPYLQATEKEDIKKLLK